MCRIPISLLICLICRRTSFQMSPMPEGIHASDKPAQSSARHPFGRTSVPMRRMRQAFCIPRQFENAYANAFNRQEFRVQHLRQIVCTAGEPDGASQDPFACGEIVQMQRVRQGFQQFVCVRQTSTHPRPAGPPMPRMRS